MGMLAVASVNSAVRVRVKITAKAADGTRSAVSPTTVVDLTSPSGSTTADQAVTELSTGFVYLEFTPSTAGRWRGLVKCSGSHTAQVPFEFDIAPASV